MEPYLREIEALKGDLDGLACRAEALVTEQEKNRAFLEICTSRLGQVRASRRRLSTMQDDCKARLMELRDETTRLTSLMTIAGMEVCARNRHGFGAHIRATYQNSRARIAIHKAQAAGSYCIAFLFKTYFESHTADMRTIHRG